MSRIRVDIYQKASVADPGKHLGFMVYQHIGEWDSVVIQHTSPVLDPQLNGLRPLVRAHVKEFLKDTRFSEILSQDNHVETRMKLL